MAPLLALLLLLGTPAAAAPAAPAGPAIPDGSAGPAPAASRDAAHTQLRATVPAEGSTLAEMPGEIRLEFSGAIELAITAVQLAGPDGAPIALAAPTHPGDTANIVVAPLVAGPTAAGTYTVRWRTAAADGHPLRGAFRFSVTAAAAALPEGPGPAGTGGPAGGGDAFDEGRAASQRAAPETLPAGGASGEPTDGARDPLYAGVRWITFLALLALIGAVVFGTVVLGTVRRGGGEEERWLAAADRRAAAVGVAAAAAVLGAAALRLYAQARALHGPAAALEPGQLGTLLSRTLWGRAWLLQVAAALLAAAGLVLRARSRAAGRGVALVAVAILGFTPALSGHAAAMADRAAAAILADGFHVLGAGGWLGGLFATVAIGLPLALRSGDDGARAAASLIRAFSPAALAFATVVVATGLSSAWLHLGSLSALWETDYGRTLLVKVGVVPVVIATGAYNWLRVKPRLGDRRAAVHLTRSATLELAAGALVLLVTAVLVATPPPPMP